MENSVSKITNVSGGQIEYAEVGEGPTVIVSHGTLGGYDQALAISHLFDHSKFRYLPVSRAGYLRSAPATGRTPQEQARSFAELLDHKGIASAAVIGASGGAPAALSFAQDFPDRCWGLVLLSAIVAAPPPMPAFFRTMIRYQDMMMRLDPMWRLVYKYGLKQLVRSNGLTPEQTKQVLQDPHLRRVVQGIYQPITNSSLRRVGMRLDHEQINSLPGEPNYALTVPTFIAHATNDPLAPVAQAKQLAAFLSAPEFEQFPDGGHLFFVVHSKQLIPKIERFLTVHSRVGV
jgi:pimeloyl-ACP methyl ester carboxylesterase